MTSAKKNTPAFHAYHVQDKNGKAFWTKIGAAWRTKSGKGFSVQLEVVPFQWDGRFMLMPPKEAPSADEVDEAIRG